MEYIVGFNPLVNPFGNFLGHPARSFVDCFLKMSVSYQHIFILEESFLMRFDLMTFEHHGTYIELESKQQKP